jgi:hypothetical protein
MSVVLLQAGVSPSVADCAIELSPRQIESLGHPPVVRIERRAGAKPSKAGALKLLAEVIENADLADDECRLSAATIKVVGVPAGDCVRLTHLECLSQNNHEESAQLEEKLEELRMREDLVEAMQIALNKLAHERDWYMQQAEKFRSQLAIASEELDLASVSCKKAARPSFFWFDALGRADFDSFIFFTICVHALLGGASGGGLNVREEPFSRAGNPSLEAQGNELAWRGLQSLIMHASSSIFPYLFCVRI